MYLGGLTINMISLFALIITLGIVVDDAIVVGEHADAPVAQGHDPFTRPKERAAQRMALPVFSATLTTVIAFFGLVAIGGPVRGSDRRHPLYRDRGADGLADGMLPDPARTTWRMR